MNDLMNPFGQSQGPQSFDKIRISIAAPSAFVHGRPVKSKSLKPSIIVHLSLKRRIVLRTLLARPRR